MANTTAVKLLETCEKGLRDLVGKAAAKGDYSGVITLTSWAKVIHDLAEAGKADSDVAKGATQVHGARSLVTPGPISSDAKTRRSSQRTKVVKPDGYPKFLRAGEDLVKLGWSKREGTEYQHKAPHRVLARLSRKLVVVGAGGSMFTADDVLPLSTDHGVEIPNYQSYLCLAWLRQEGLIRSHGRQGYTVNDGENLVSAVDSRWRALTQ